MRALLAVAVLVLGAASAAAAGGSYAYTYLTPFVAHHTTESGGETWCNCYVAIEMSGDVTFTMDDASGVHELGWELRDVGTFDVCFSGSSSGTVTVHDVAPPCSVGGAYPVLGTTGTLRYEWTG